MDVTTLRDGVRERLGEILIRRGRLSQEQLNEAIVAAKASGDRLGTHLVNAKALHEEDISIALADQFGLRYVVVDVDQLTPDLAAICPSGPLRRLSVLPLSVSGETCPDRDRRPERCRRHRRARMALTSAFELVVADPSAIRAGLERVYPLHRPTSAYAEEAEAEPRITSETIDAEGDAESAPAVEEVNRLLRCAIDLGASDIHFVPSEKRPPRSRSRRRRDARRLGSPAVAAEPR